jgi:hypothetical protein
VEVVVGDDVRAECPSLAHAVRDLRGFTGMVNRQLNWAEFVESIGG